MNIYLWIILAALLVDYFLHALSRFLDLKNLSTDLPDEFTDHYSSEEYARSQEYLRENTRFSYFTSSFDLIIILLVIFLGLFNTIDLWLRDFGFSPIISGLIFFGVLFFIQDVVSTPFSLCRTFVIEEKFGFNKTTPKTYILDKLKSYFLLFMFGGLVLSLILYFFESFGDMAWLYAWVAMSGFLVLVQPLFTMFIAPIISGLIFFGVLFFIQDIVSTPFSLYRTFVIEEKFGFNKTTPKTYILDKLKSYLLLLIIGSLVLSLILYFFESFGDMAWLYAWVAISGFLVLVQPLFNLVIAPMFNTFNPLEDGELKDKINQFARRVNFPISRIDVMDGSRRSSKANAYFSGLGKNKRIALFDTLIEKHSVDELVSIIAHEVGHYKKKHNIKGIVLGVIQTGIMFFMLSIFLNNSQLFAAFRMENLSVYASLLFFSILYSPIELIMSFAGNAISRKHEFEADAFARESIGTGEYLIEGLKKLTVTNLGNLTPHPLTVWLSYSHPPVLNRIISLRHSD